jgi:ABC-type multidrug transport system fused ATPase/permease subunit
LLQGAKLEENGTHEELMARGQTYAELYKTSSKYYQEANE